MSITEQSIQTALKEIVDPNTGKDYVPGKEARNIKIDGSDISVDILLGYPAKTRIEPIRAACEALGKRLVSVYLGANREDLIVRFLQRYRADREDRAEHYSRRLMHLLDEQGAWANAAAYDVVEKQFGEATLDSVLERIQAQIAQGAVWVADDSGLRVTH